VDKVVADGGLETNKLVVGVAVAVDDLHLLHERALARLTSTCTCQTMKSEKGHQDDRQKSREQCNSSIEKRIPSIR
jgi:hypothetical protein